MSSMIAAPYINSGNDFVLSLVPTDVRRVLDVGCGAGNNACRLRAERPYLELVGITHSDEEASLAAPHFDRIIVADLETIAVDSIEGDFDLIIFCHVLEHLSDPVGLIQKLSPLLLDGGHVLIALPNILEWRSRLKLLMGRFEYEDHGVFDKTHLRFYTYQSAAKELIEFLPNLGLEIQKGNGAAPLGPFRRRLIPQSLRLKIDSLAVSLWPNLFAQEIALLARLKKTQ